MAATGTSFVKVQRNLLRFMTVLQSAACEWFLIFLLFIDAALSYLLTKFASYCRLQIPCMFCSRLDHFLGNEKPGFYQNVICSNHRSEISSLISCHIHGKLSNGYGMCEECLLSSTMKSKSSVDIERLLMGKYGFKIGAYGFENFLWGRELVSGSVGTGMCSCCDKPWRSRQPSNRVAQLKSPRSGMTKPNIPMPRHLTHRENIKKRGENFPGSVRSHRLVRCGYNPGSQVAYTELKFTSDSESEFPFSDDDEGRSISHKMKELKEEPIAPPKTLSDCISLEKTTYHSLKGLASDVELKRQQADHENYPSALPQLISFDDFPSSSSVMDAPVGVSLVRSELKFPFSQNYNLSALSDFMSLAVPSSFNAVEGSLEASERKSNDTGTGDKQDISINKQKEISILTASTRGGGQVANELPSINSDNVDLIDVWKPSANGGDRESNTSMAKKQTVNGPERVDEESTEMPTENVFAEGPDLSSHNTITRIEGHDDELQMNDALRSNGVQILKTEIAESSGHESLEGSFVSEIEGESIIDRLKRQVESDRRHISTLYKELEEERSASAIAANQAMAMITRLQDEKAALHMEALQYLRMMEEQAEYDVEALEKANDLLAEKEKEIQDLEAEIDSLQLNLPDESTAETIHVESANLNVKNMSLENTSRCYDETIIPCSSLLREVLSDDEKPACVKSSLSGYEDEKLLISQHLKVLERKLHQFASLGGLPFMANSDYSEEAAHGGLNAGESLDHEGSQTAEQTEEDNSSMDSPVSNGSLPAHGMSSASFGKHQVVANNESNHLIFYGKKSSKQHKEIDLVVLENEISDLNGRLEALEFDRNFLEHAFNSLQSGKEGLQFVQEIAHHLQELWKMGMRNSSWSAP